MEKEPDVSAKASGTSVQISRQPDMPKGRRRNRAGDKRKDVPHRPQRQRLEAGGGGLGTSRVPPMSGTGSGRRFRAPRSANFKGPANTLVGERRWGGGARRIRRADLMLFRSLAEDHAATHELHAVQLLDVACQCLPRRSQEGDIHFWPASLPDDEHGVSRSSGGLEPGLASFD
ncbi:hypothetical protein CDEST_01097 [Colletotrichum destructivum]|uniref:Uncharacterized protein n=1 Tax=Colletotrichum destructivum TaxID=34406 RepID=A0AAX4HY11_9PEZI|nr:hypothetical protein CDEST_01097 [Colletotrichum destructivum]